MTLSEDERGGAASSLREWTAPLLAGCGAIFRFSVARPRIVLFLAVAAPFVPYALELIRKGVPDVLLGGDGSPLELRTLYAARGVQMVGPYSRFLWSHPGPAFFYLALPFYLAFHERGPALNLFALAANFAALLALVLSARRLGGGLFALVVAALLAMYGIAGDPFALASAWNPVVSILPLALVSFLCARLAAGGARVLPGFVFVGSAIVQTHVGYVPVTFVLCVLGGLFYFFPRLIAGPLDPGERRHPRWALGAAAIVLVVMWALPAYQNATGRPGNIYALWKFFTTPHPREHTWAVAAQRVVGQLAVMPLAILHTFAPAVARAPAETTLWALAVVPAVGLLAIVLGRRRHDDHGAALLSVVAIGEILVAVPAVRAIRGEIAPYLVGWISVLGVVSCAALAAWLVPAATRLFGARAARVGLSGLAIAAIALSIRSRGGSPPVVPEPQRDTERVVRDVEAYIVSGHIERPVVRVAAEDRWPEAASLVLSLYKHRIPVLVAKDWVFMMGPQLAPDAEEHPVLLVGDGKFEASARARADLRRVAASGDLCVYLEEPGYVRKHRLVTKISVVSATGVAGDPELAVDGVVPDEGTPWDSPRSLILLSETSKLEITVPPGDLTGLFLSADGNDTYALRCVRASGSIVPIGMTSTVPGYGMRTRLVFSQILGGCRSIELSPQEGDGLYSLGEIGFVTR
jgi:hypothetical protein